MEQKEFVKINSILNRKDGQLPFGYYFPDDDGKTTWNCGYDQENKIVSVFCHTEDGHRDKKINILKDIETAASIRDSLINAGWKELEAPKINIKYDDGSSKPMNRKQKRKLQQTLHKMSKENPFENEEK